MLLEDFSYNIYQVDGPSHVAIVERHTLLESYPKVDILVTSRL